MSAPRGQAIPASEGVRQRRKSTVMQSSLDLVFSYSRSQQLLYGQNLRSAPSFLDLSPSSTSGSSQTGYGAIRTRPSDPELGLETPDDTAIAEGVEEEAETGVERAPFDISPDQLTPVSPGQRLGDMFETENEDMETPRPGVAPLLPDPNFSLRPNLGRTVTARRISDVSPAAAAKVNVDEATPLLERAARRASGAAVDEDTRARSSSRRRSSARRMSHARRRSSSARRDISIRGESTEGQTLFNAVAVLLGIGLLSLPLALSYAGWILGSIMVFGFAAVTCHTAKLLARLIAAEPMLMGYTDIGRMAFGRYGSLAINMMFCMELFALSVAFMILFGDTLEALLPRLTSNIYKIIGLFFVLPTTFLPLRLLSLPSFLSTISTILLVAIIILDGFIKTSSPGSILHPPPTHIWPQFGGQDWLGAVGLILAGVGGHAVMPSLARDMDHPERFDSVMNKAFGTAAIVSFIAGSAGYLMIGNAVSDEITRDLLLPMYGYPRVLNIIVLCMIVAIPLTKFGLCTRPLHLTIESLLGIAPRPHAQGDVRPNDHSHISDIVAETSSFLERDLSPVSARRRSTLSKPSLGDLLEEQEQESSPKGKPAFVMSIGVRTLTTVLSVLVAIYIPGFEKVMAFLGSFAAFLISIILPVGFWLRLAPVICAEKTSRIQRAVHWMILGCSIVLMVAGTVWAFV